MHAHLLIGKDEGALAKQVKAISKQVGAQVFEFSLQKIADVRELAKFTNLSHTQKYLVYIKDINKASVEALNAFLKNLEEPQENISFVLTAETESSVLPTIVSRCEVTKIKGETLDSKTIKEMANFMGMETAEKLAHLANIKDRGEAITFLSNLIFAAHETIGAGGKDLSTPAKIAKSATETKARIEANGNVNLQLTNFAIQTN